MIAVSTSPLAAAVTSTDAAPIVEAFGFWATFWDVIAFACLIVGSAFSLLAVVGILRMPDVYARMQAATKAGTLGVAFIVFGVAAHFASIGVLAEGLLIVTFLFLTTPIASHLIGRAAYLTRVKIWANTWRDDLRGSYDQATHTLDGNSSIDIAAPDETQPNAGDQTSNTAKGKTNGKAGSREENGAA